MARPRKKCATCGAKSKSRVARSAALSDAVAKATNVEAMGGDTIPPPSPEDISFGVEEPLISSWKVRPPKGNWDVSVRVKGRARRFSGPPRKIALDILNAHKSNGLPMTSQKVWDWLNTVWGKRDPGRAIMVNGRTRSSAAPPSPDAHVYTTPEHYGPRLWASLSLFGMKGAFDKESWISAINQVTRLIDPQESWATGCEECFSEWAKIRMDTPPDKVENEHDAAKWVFDAHNRVNKKLGKRVLAFHVAVRENGWAFKIINNKTTPE